MGTSLKSAGVISSLYVLYHVYTLFYLFKSVYSLLDALPVKSILKVPIL